MRLWLTCLFLFAFCSAQTDDRLYATHHENHAQYKGHALVRVRPESDGHVTALHQFHKQHAPHGRMEFWRHPTLEREGDIRSSAEFLPQLSEFLHEKGITHHIVQRDISRLMRDEHLDDHHTEQDPMGFNLTRYHTYNEIMDWLDELQYTCGDLCSVFDIGTSTQGRKLRVIRIGRGTTASTPAVWIDAGIHAREWIAPATAVYLIHKLIEGSKARDPVTRQLVTRYVWYILPIANPDGYSYTWRKDRLWRKTRSSHPHSKCRGADPNRNWNYHWGGRGTSGNPCSDNYHGRFPFSEPETRAMANFLWVLRQQLQVYLSLHSYGQYWLTPWGFTYNVPDDYTDMIHQATQATSAMTSNNYTVGSSARLLYLASGGSDDWAKGMVGTKYSYTVELSDTGEHGFILPPTYITPVGRQMYKAIQTLAVGVLRERRKMLRSRRRQ